MNFIVMKRTPEHLYYLSRALFLLATGVYMSFTLQKLIQNALKNINEINVEQLKDSYQNYTIIDVREANELEQGIVPNAIHIPRGLLEFKIDKVANGGIKPDTAILLYCQAGFRSVLAAQSLVDLGYKNVTSLTGGYAAWAK